MKKCDQKHKDEGSSKEKDKKGKKTVANIAEDEVTTESASLASICSHHFLPMTMVMFMFSLPLRLSASFLINQATISSLIQAVPATSVHIANSSWMKPLPPSRNLLRFISGTHLLETSVTLGKESDRGWNQTSDLQLYMLVL